MRVKGSAERLEQRRRWALALLDEGHSLNEVGRLVGCAASSVMRWRDARKAGGDKALKVKTSPGRPTKLTPEQRKGLIRLLSQGALAHGYRTELWTTARIAEVIEKHFGVVHHRDHVGRLMGSLGWSYQKPSRRALERNEEEIERWKQKEWPRVREPLRGWVPISSSSTNRASSAQRQLVLCTDDNYSCAPE
jgi:transposase